VSIIKAQSLREKTDQELLDQMMIEKKSIFDSIMKSATGESVKAHQKRDGKRLIARISTILRERQVRRELDKRIVELTQKSQGASPNFEKMAQRAVRPQIGRVRFRGAGALPPADRACVALAEARRVRAAVDRKDVGETK